MWGHAWGRDMWYTMVCVWGTSTRTNTHMHDHVRHANTAHLHAEVTTHTHTQTHTHTLTHSIHYSFPPSQSIRPLAHTEANTYYTHTVNLTPCSNAERIVPGLGDIKSLDYPIKSYSPPLPHLRKISGINHCTVLWGKGVVCACKCERTNTIWDMD